MTSKPRAIMRRTSAAASSIARAIGRSKLNPTQRLRARARENKQLLENPETHAAIAAAKKGVAHTSETLQKARTSQQNISAARARAEAMSNSSVMWPKGTQWIKRSGAWVRKKTIPVVNPIDAWRATRVTAREQMLERRQKGSSAQKSNLIESANQAKEPILRNVTRRLPSIRKRMANEMNDIISALGKPPFSGAGKERAKIARDYLYRITDAEQLIDFDVLLQKLHTSVKRQDLQTTSKILEKMMV